MLPSNGFGRSEVCAGCMKETRVCLNCRFHDTGSYNECRETVAERIVDKDRSNFCDFFKPKGSLPRNETLRASGRNTGNGSGNGNSANNSNKSRNAGGSTAAWAAAEALFKRN
ncbi:MAG: hypothetical protein HQL98_10330 [Magnetococcales bacterium]|nr:hypothetical protein [Magnetococcales bacterium]